MSRINWDNFDLLGGPSVVKGFKVVIAYKPKPAWPGKNGAMIYEVSDQKDVTNKFEALIGAYFEHLEKKGMVMCFDKAGLVVLTLGTIEDKLKKIKELAQDIRDFTEDGCAEDFIDAADEIEELVDSILKLKGEEAGA